MITLVCRSHSYAYEMEHLVRLFFPGEPVEVIKENVEQGDLVITAVENGRIYACARFSDPAFEMELEDEVRPGDDANETERRLGVLLFCILHTATTKRPPWGILTGVRPVRLLRLWEMQGLDGEQIRRRFCGDYLAMPDKVDLVQAIAEVQRPVLARSGDRSYSLYVSIPFCPTRCLYCSFVSHAIDKAHKLIPEYMKLLARELACTAELAKKLGLELQTIYVGGGTPTALDDESFAFLLEQIEAHFDTKNLFEYTVEAGRPDTVNRQKLGYLRKFGVGRISINPQTMDDTILRTIGRSHTAAQVAESYALAREMGFSSINMDLIAGLPGDTQESFAHTLDAILGLRPENITLHTLTVKRSSDLRDADGAYDAKGAPLEEMLAEAAQRLSAGGYRPYYLYRQKGMVQGLENTGWSLPGQDGIYNIYSMEEAQTTLAVGAGGVTKLCRGREIVRTFNLKYPYEYIRRFDDILARKASVEEFYARYH